MTKKKKGKPMDGVRDGSNMVEETEDSTDYKARCEAMERDWAVLNTFLNDTARVHHWCWEYEERLHKYNRKFTTLALVGRSAKDVGDRADPYYRQMIQDQRNYREQVQRAREHREQVQREAAERAYTERHGHRPGASATCALCNSSQQYDDGGLVRQPSNPLLPDGPDAPVPAADPCIRVRVADPYTMVRFADDGQQFVRVTWDQSSPIQCPCPTCRRRRGEEVPE